MKTAVTASRSYHVDQAKMNIRKHTNGNEYIRAGDVWVRNFTKRTIAPRQLTNLFSPEDYGLVLSNEQLNNSLPRIGDETLVFKKIVIVSDGYDFEDRHTVIGKLPADVCVLAVNGALKKWKLLLPSTPSEERKPINGYIINNPYQNSLAFMPSKESMYFPTCIASTRTSHQFVKKYRGDVYSYRPTFEKTFSFDTAEKYHIDDYRNPICAAIGLAYQFGVEKLMLLCCDDSFEEKRDGSIQLANGLWTYQPLIRSHSIVDANLYWLTHQEDKDVRVANYSSGPECLNAVYINDKVAACSFFKDHVEGTST